jgi:hypothetical protein
MQIPNGEALIKRIEDVHHERRGRGINDEFDVLVIALAEEYKEFRAGIGESVERMGQALEGLPKE